LKYVELGLNGLKLINVNWPTKKTGRGITFFRDLSS